MKDDMKIEMEAHKNQQLERVIEVMTDPAIHMESLKRTNENLAKENYQLKIELDKAIHQLKDYEKALKKYADEKNWNEDLGGNYNFHYIEKYRPKTFEGFLECVFDHPIAPIVYNGLSLAEETLKKWENK